MGIRDSMRQLAAEAHERGEKYIEWVLRPEYVEELAADSRRVLGYKAPLPTSFLGAPIRLCGLDKPNHLVTSATKVLLPKA